MAKNIISLIILLGTIGGGIAYGIYSAPDLPATLLFRDTLQAFGKQSSRLETQFSQTNSLNDISLSSLAPLVFDFQAPGQQAFRVDVKMSVDNNQVTLRYADDLPIFTGQSIVLQPFTKEGSVRWKCIGGSVLVRYRTKNCRLGYGFIASNSQ